MKDRGLRLGNAKNYRLPFFLYMLFPVGKAFERDGDQVCIRDKRTARVCLVRMFIRIICIVHAAKRRAST